MLGVLSIVVASAIGRTAISSIVINAMAWSYTSAGLSRRALYPLHYGSFADSHAAAFARPRSALIPALAPPVEKNLLLLEFCSPYRLSIVMPPSGPSE